MTHDNRVWQYQAHVEPVETSVTPDLDSWGVEITDVIQPATDHTWQYQTSVEPLEPLVLPDLDAWGVEITDVVRPISEHYAALAPSSWYTFVPNLIVPVVDVYADQVLPTQYDDAAPGLPQFQYLNPSFFFTFEDNLHRNKSTLEIPYGYPDDISQDQKKLSAYLSPYFFREEPQSGPEVFDDEPLPRTYPDLVPDNDHLEHTWPSSFITFVPDLHDNPFDNAPLPTTYPSQVYDWARHEHVYQSFFFTDIFETVEDVFSDEPHPVEFPNVVYDVQHSEYTFPNSFFTFEDDLHKTPEDIFANQSLPVEYPSFIFDVDRLQYSYETIWWVPKDSEPLIIIYERDVFFPIAQTRNASFPVTHTKKARFV